MADAGTITRRALLGAGLAGAAGAVTLYFDLLPVRRDAPGQAVPPQSYLRITGEGRLTLFTGKAELGQGILTALVQIAADELDIAPERIDVISADTGSTPDEGYTFGSLSVQRSGVALRRAAAELRAILLSGAAQRLESSVELLSVEDGRVSDGARGVTYWEIARAAPSSSPAEGTVAPKPPHARRLAGSSLPRIDIPAKVFAEGRFLHDLRLPGMLHGRVVRPPSYRARLETADLAAARAVEGVEAVVRDGSFLGVVARREVQAIAAAEALRGNVRWKGGDVLPSHEMLAGFIRSHPATETEWLAEREGPAPEGGTRHRAAYFRPFQAHAAIGPSVAVALFEEGRLTVHSHTQGVFPLRGALAEALGMSPADIRVVHGEGSGCYGHNGADDAALDAALLSRAAGGRPVRVQWMRADEFLWEPYGSAMVMEAAATLSDDGRILDWDYGVRGFSHSSRPGGKAGNLLAARHLGEPFPEPPPVRLSQPKGGLDRNAMPLYRFPRLRIAKHFILASPVRVSALRGLGAYGNIFAIESFMDELAHAAGIDPAELRLRHLEDSRARAVISAATASDLWARGPGSGRGLAFARYKNSGGYLAVVAAVSVDRATGAIRLEAAHAAVDCGEIVNPDGVRNQVEGGLVQSASWTLAEEVRTGPDGLGSADWASYPILGFADVPRLAVTLLDRPESPPLGSGEVAQGPMAAAIANAVFDATGVRLRDLPFTPERVRAALLRSP